MELFCHLELERSDRNKEVAALLYHIYRLTSWSAWSMPSNSLLASTSWWGLLESMSLLEEWIIVDLSLSFSLSLSLFFSLSLSFSPLSLHSLHTLALILQPTNSVTQSSLLDSVWLQWGTLVRRETSSGPRVAPSVAYSSPKEPSTCMHTTGNSHAGGWIHTWDNQGFV